MVNRSEMQARFRQPWTASDDAEMVTGSLHADRILVPEPRLRLLLKKFRGLSHDVSVLASPRKSMKNCCMAWKITHCIHTWWDTTLL